MTDVTTDTKTPKILYLDVDYRISGTASIGSDERIEQVFGFKPLHIKNFQSFDKFVKDNIEEYKVSDFENAFRFKPPYDDVDIVVVDSLTGLQTQIKRDLQKTGNMTMDLWGKLGDKMERLLHTFCCMSVDVIFTIHSKDVEDGEFQRRIEIPGLQGSVKDNLARYLDVMIYTTVSTNKLSKVTNFQWQVIPDEHRNARALPGISDFASETNGIIDQDYKLLFNLIRKSVTGPVKIGIIGFPGTGKTHSCRTLKNVEIL